MAITKTKVVVVVDGAVAVGGTKAAPTVLLANPGIDCSSYAGGELQYKITNGASAPGVGLTLMIQQSPDGANWYDYAPAAGEVAAGGVYTGSIPLRRGVKYIRPVAYGHTTNPVNVEVNLSAVAG